MVMTIHEGARRGAVPKLQLALDGLDRSQCLAIARAAADSIDIIEIGTPCVKVHGLSFVEEIRSEFCDKTLLVDLKTMDAGAYEVQPFLAAGADIVTVLAMADETTIANAVSVASRYGGCVQVDLMNVAAIDAGVKRAADLGASIAGIHTGIDAQSKGHHPFVDLQRAAAAGVAIELSVAGGIHAESVGRVLGLGASIVVVGSGITAAADPGEAARRIRDSLRRSTLQACMDSAAIPPPSWLSRPSLRRGRVLMSDHPALQIHSHLETDLQAMDGEALHALETLICTARRLFMLGCGRSGLVARLFAMRAMQLGFEVYSAGDVNTPKVQAEDLIISLSASGITPSLLAIGERVRSVGAQMAVITQSPESPMARLATLVIAIQPQPSLSQTANLLPLGSRFELSALLFLEGMVAHLMDRLNIHEEALRQRHSILE